MSPIPGRVRKASSREGTAQAGRGLRRGMLPPRRRWIVAVALVTVAGVVSAQGRSSAQEVSTDSLRSYTRVLAHDSLRGRRPGTRGERLAAEILENRLRSLGLRPLPGRSGMTLPVPLTVHTFGEGARIEVRSRDGEQTLRPPDFYHPGGGPASYRDFGGQVIAGGATPGALEALRDADVEGRVVVLGPPWEGIGEVEEELRRRGASGAVEAVPNGAFYDRLRVVRGPDRYALPPEVDDPDNQGRLPRVVVGPEALEELGLAEVVRPGRTLEEALPTESSVRVRLDVSRRSTTAHNVAAVLPASPPKTTGRSSTSDRAIVYLAHYDHVGIAQPVGRDSIWNGFVDNAAGVAVLLESARVLSADPLPRPVVFLFTTAEEQGLLGATWFVHRSAYPAHRIRGVINIDGGAPPPDVGGWQVAAPDGSELRSLAARTLRDAGWSVTERPIRSDSDHWAFHRRGIPALFLYPESLAGDLRVHTPKDEWRADFPFEGLVRYGEAALAVGRGLAADADPWR